MQPNVKSNELQSPCSKSLMVRYPSLIAIFLILEAHTDMDMATHVYRKDTSVREVSQTCPMIQKIFKK